MNETVYIGIPFTKVDAATRTVTGVVTNEILDRQGDIVDYKTAAPFFTDDARWPGNIREQHDPRKPVGSKVSAVLDETGKSVTLTAYISEACPDTWTKVLDGTLKGFSIGGAGRREVEKQGDKTYKRLYLEQLAEVSLVDNPANPQALFTVAKAVDGVMVIVEPQTATEAAMATAAAAVAAAVEKAKGADDEKHKTASGKEGKRYAGTDGKSFPITDPKDVHNAAKALGRTDQDRAKVKANIIRIAYDLGPSYVAQLPDAWKKQKDQKDAAATPELLKWGYGMPYADGECCPEPYDIQTILSAIATLEQAIASEMGEPGEMAEEDTAQLTALRAAVTAAIAFLQSEFEEQFEDDDASDEGKAARAAIRKASRVELASALFTASLPVIVKAGARHSKKDVEMIQNVHDLSNSLGADCYTDMDKVLAHVREVGYAVEKAKKKDDGSDDETKCPTCKGTGKIRGGKVTCPECDGAGTVSGDDDKAAVATSVEKLTAAFDALKADHETLKATVSEKDKTIASQEERLKVLENAPAGGGPVRSAHAVEKTLGGPGETAAASGEEAIKLLQRIATEHDSPEVRRAMSAEIIKHQRSMGVGQLVFRPGPSEQK